MANVSFALVLNVHQPACNLEELLQHPEWKAKEPLPLIQHPRPHLPRVFRCYEAAQRLREERNTHEEVIVSFSRIDIHIHRLWHRDPIPCQASMRSCLLYTHRLCLLRLVHPEPATVPHREPLLHEVTLRWPREPERSDELLAHSLHQQGSEAFTKQCAVNLEALLVFPADHSASRMLGHTVMPERARLGGEGVLRREATLSSSSIEAALSVVQQEVRGLLKPT